jgi:hypothetical protein
MQGSTHDVGRDFRRKRKWRAAARADSRTGHRDGRKDVEALRRYSDPVDNVPITVGKLLQLFASRRLSGSAERADFQERAAHAGAQV